MTAGGAATPCCVFVGPTLDVQSAAARLPGAIFLPPAAQGDVYEWAQRRPAAIAIIDGYFERVPSVWHKEVLWALSQGIPVYGSSSMGALRAAELASFGMTGVGWIYRQFACGAITDDDEVTIVHASADDDYRAGSEAMVNIRRTLEAAVDAGIITEAAGASLVQRSKGQFYPDRSWAQVVHDARTMCGEDVATDLRSWLRTGRVDQKRLDAEELLDVLATSDAGDISVPWRFNHTVYWSALVGSAEPGHPAHAVSSTPEVPTAAVLDELRLDYGAYTAAYRSALIRTLSELVADAFGMQPDDETVDRAIQRHMEGRQLDGDDEIEIWLAANGLTPSGVQRLARQDVRFDRVHRRLVALTQARLIDNLRWSGTFATLAARAARKQDHCGTQTSADSTVDPTALSAEWFAHNGLPEPPDTEQWVRDAGYGQIRDFNRMLLRENDYRHAELT